MITYLKKSVIMCQNKIIRGGRLREYQLFTISTCRISSICAWFWNKYRCFTTSCEWFIWGCGL